MLGQIANTNAQHISKRLNSIGVGVLYHVAVGDNLERMKRVISTAAARSDAVIVTGGLGPTPDDITREGVAGAFGLKLNRDEELARRVRAIFTRLGRVMPERNLRQADLPETAVAIEPEGTAPGFYLEHGSTLVFAIPGVPWEMEAMLDKTVVPVLAGRAGGGAIVSREVLVIGLGESHTHELIADVVEAQTNPSIAFLAGAGVVRVRITAAGATDTDASRLIDPIEARVRARLGAAAVLGGGETIAESVGLLLRARSLTVATAESLTGGLVGAELSSRGGASDFYVGSLVCYSNAAKRDVAGVNGALLDEHGAVSEEVAGALAEAAAERFGADLGLSATGVAGPAGQEGEPAGTVYVGARYRGRTRVRRVHGYGARSNVRALAVNSALDLGRRILLDL